MQTLEGGFVALHRSILNWEWYGDKNTKVLFIHLIITANYAPARWKGHNVKVGQRITSLSKLAHELGMSVKEVRTAIGHLKETGEISCVTNNQFSLITINNYEKFQVGITGNSGASKRANEGQTRGKAGANEGQQRNKNNKNNKKNNNIAPPASPETGEPPRPGEDDSDDDIIRRLAK